MLTYYEPAAFTWNYYSRLTRGCYLERFGIPRIGVTFLGALRPRRVHRHASGAAQGKVGALPALNHKPELNAGSCLADAIWFGTSLLVHARRKQGGHEKQICGRAAGCMGSLTAFITLLIFERGSFLYRTPRPDCPFRAHFNLWWARHGWPLIHLVSRQDGQFSRPPYFRRP